jgi:hypothetical protein
MLYLLFMLGVVVIGIALIPVALAVIWFLLPWLLMLIGVGILLTLYVSQPLAPETNVTGVFIALVAFGYGVGSRGCNTTKFLANT